MPVQTQPQQGTRIHSVVGTVAHDSIVTITGLNLGSHAQYHGTQGKLARMWENFETGNFTSNPYGKWGLFSPPALSILKDSPTKRGGKNDHYLFRRNNLELGALEIPGQDHKEYFLSHYIRISDSFSVCEGQTHQWKLSRFTSVNNKVNVYPDYNCNGNSTLFVMGIEFTNPQILGHQTYISAPFSTPQKNWHRWDIYIKKASDSAAYDGILQIYIDNKLVYDFKKDTGIPYLNGKGFSNSNGDFAGSIFIGSYFSGASANTYVDYDDIYLDHTLARVEIGENPNWNECTHSEIQPPISWSQDSIKIKVNQGTFSQNGTAYFFVIDKSGTASDGYAITFSN